MWESNSQMMKCRGVYRAPEIPFLEHEELPPDEVLGQPEDLIPWRDACAYILRNMRTRERRMVAKWFFEEKTLREVAAIEKLSAQRVREIVFRAFDRVRYDTEMANTAKSILGGRL